MAVSESSGIYYDPRRMTSPTTARIGVKASPTGRHARGGATAAEHVQISMSALWTPALRLSLELEFRTERLLTARAPALIQTGLNMFFRRREAHKRHAANQILLLQNRKSSFTVIRRFLARKKLSGEPEARPLPSWIRARVWRKRGSRSSYRAKPHLDKYFCFS
jgi:hypothetical protein